jgi:L-asparagine transporter-like permease
MAYAFSRDGAMPFSNVWHKVNKKEVPVNAVWLAVAIGFCMALTVFITYISHLDLVNDLQFTCIYAFILLVSAVFG